MTTLMHLRFNGDRTTRSLYVRPMFSGGIVVAQDGTLRTSQSTEISLDTYFNAFFETAYGEYTNIHACEWQLSLLGDVGIRLLRRRNDGTEKCIAEHSVQNAVPDRMVSLPFAIDREHPGRIFLECVLRSSDAGILSGRVTTEEKPARDVRLAIVVCTYNRPEYVAETVRRIMGASETFEMPWHLFIVDNGRNFLLDREYEQVTVMPNRNIGGSGGFSLGMLTAGREGYSHVLCMDDDISIEPDVIPRLASIAMHCRENMIVGGAMLNMERPTVLHESGALHNTSQTGVGPLRWTPLFHGDHAEARNTLDKLTHPETIQDYQALWCCLYPMTIVERLGLLMPYFMRQEDVEYSLRAHRLSGTEIHTWPGIAVWQKSFESKHRHWIEYYIIRNLIITDCLHRRGTYPLSALLKQAQVWFLKHLYLLRYAEASMVVQAMEDVLRGPEWLSALDAEAHHGIVLKTVTEHLREEAVRRGSACPSTPGKKRRNPAQKLIALLTLNGHLLSAMNAEGHTRDASADASQTFRRSTVFAVRIDGVHVRRRRNARLALRLFGRWVRVCVRYVFLWNTVSKQWHERGLCIATEEEWKKRFDKETPFMSRPAGLRPHCESEANAKRRM